MKQNSLSLGKWTEEENPNAFVPGSEARADKYSTRPPAAFTMNFTKGRACHNGLCVCRLSLKATGKLLHVLFSTSFMTQFADFPGVERSSRVHMYCGDTNRVDSVQETELCKCVDRTPSLAARYHAIVLALDLFNCSVLASTLILSCGASGRVPAINQETSGVLGTKLVSSARMCAANRAC